MDAQRPAGSGRARRRGVVTHAAALLLVFLPLLAPGGGGADAARQVKALQATTGSTCVMARCKVCQMHVAPYSKKGNRRPGVVRYCVRPKKGYQIAPDKRSVPSEC
jgi:hypothetical protein